MQCEACGEDSFLIPLHGGKGGPLRCPLCVGKWNAEHGKRRRTGRIVIRALKAFFDAGGKREDVDKLKLDASDYFDIDTLGYLDGAGKFVEGDIDLTSELLASVLQLTHPDHHPPERKVLAHTVTQQLLALKPFVFPATKPEPIEPIDSDDVLDETLQRPARERAEKQDGPPRYPCSDCRDAFPEDYCDACRTEYERREQEEFDKRTSKQRAEYAERRKQLLAKRPSAVCVCGKKFKAKRADARYCSARCRQNTHRKPVTDKSSGPEAPSFNCDKVRRSILALVHRHRALYLNDLLPDNRTTAQYQAVAKIVRELESEGKIDRLDYMCRFGKPGHKVLMKLGYKIDEPRDIPLLKDGEKLKL
jgi:hypothetical protein